MSIIEYKGYQARIDYDGESSTLLGTVLNLSDVVTFQTKKMSDVKTEFEAAIEDYLETCKELGKSPDKPFSGTFNVRVGEALHRKLATEAVRKNTSLNDFVKVCLEQCFETSDRKLSGEMSVTIHVYESKEKSRLTGNIGLGEVTQYESNAIGPYGQSKRIRTPQLETAH